MSFRFDDILAQEMKAVGIAAPSLPATPATRAAALPAVRTAPAAPAALTAPAVTLAFSGEARRLSFSLHEYGRDKSRAVHRDSGIAAGECRTGYLWKTADGLRGEMRFTTGSGDQVRVVAGSAENEEAGQVRVFVDSGGREYDFALEELAEASLALPPPGPSGLPALESGSLGREKEREGCAPAPAALAYSSRGAGLVVPGGLRYSAGSYGQTGSCRQVW